MDADTPIQSIENALQPSKLPGTTWVTRYKGQRWPVVLCDEALPPEAFMQTRRGRERPAILLGKHIFIWVEDDLLSEHVSDTKKETYLDGHPRIVHTEAQPEDSAEVKIEKLRQIAFLRDAVHRMDDKFWYNHMLQKSETRKLERQMAGPKKRKRSGTNAEDARTPKRNGNYSYPRTLQSPSSKPRMTDLTKRAKVSAMYDESDSDEEVVFVSQSSTRNTATGDLLTENGRKTLKEDGKVFNSNGTCEVLVGQDRKSFVLEQHELDGCTYLQRLQQKNNHSGGTVIDLAADLPNLTPDEFGFVSNFMQIKTIDTTSVYLVLAFSAASKVQHKPMQENILKQLKSQYPLDPTDILTIANIVCHMPIPRASLGVDFVNWVFDHIVDYFWTLATEKGRELQSLLENDNNLRSVVYEKLAKDSQAGKGGF